MHIKLSGTLTLTKYFKFIEIYKVDSILYN